MWTTKLSRKGESPLSESTLAIISLIISFILIAMFANSILSTQSNVAYHQAVESITRDIAIAIDRACGLAGSTKIEYEIPKGVKLNVSIDYKSIQASFDSSIIVKSFSCMRLANKVSFVEPNNLCIVKNRNDRKVFVIEGKCKCKINDGVCDPACAAENICDPDCYKSESDGICLGICVKNNDGICDPDCYRNESDYVWNLDCRNEEKDGICDPDSHNIADGVCDQDCYTKESVVCDPDCKPKDENNDKEEDEKDGFCYTACKNSTFGEVFQNDKNYNIIENYRCDPNNASNRRCGNGRDIYACGRFVEICRTGGRLRCNDIVLCEGNECTQGSGAWCHSGKEPNVNKTVCCCEASGRCYIENSMTCIVVNAGQTYPLNHEYCKGLTDSGKTSESNLLKSKIFLLPDGICDKDCEEENGICDPDCTKDKDCKMQCAKLGENCSSLPPCPGEGICCPGDKIVRKNCCGNGICEPREMWLPGNETKWENFYTCRQDCNSTKDNTCARVLDNVCDPDCVDNFQKYGQANYLYCDPDCISQHSGICPYTDPTQQSIQDGICLEIIDNVCDPDCVNDTLRCDPDCCNGFNVANPCAASPGCHCPTRANISSNFNGAFWFSETNNEPDCNRHNPNISPNVIEICSQEAIEFLNRRGWDIKEVEKSLKTSPPEGFAFDFSRYETIVTEGVQKASKTIKANEEYNLSEPSCCCRSDCSCGACINSTICCGVGFCGDHGVAILSILRTLGVPAKDVFDTFTGVGGSCMRHSFVVYKCDPELPENMKLEECQNNWNEWMIVDATGHFVSALRGSGSCSNLCIWWNDYGVYPTIDPNLYGFGGKIDATRGRPFPQETGCSVGGACAMDRVCQLFGINCIS